MIQRLSGHRRLKHLGQLRWPHGLRLRRCLGHRSKEPRCPLGPEAKRSSFHFISFHFISFHPFYVEIDFHYIFISLFYIIFSFHLDLLGLCFPRQISEVLEGGSLAILKAFKGVEARPARPLLRIERLKTLAWLEPLKPSLYHGVQP